MVLRKLPKPFFVLAPMYDVTDTVFRQIVSDCSPPDLLFTEFVNVDGLQSPGREKLLDKLLFTSKEKPIFAQIWGKEPKNFFKTAKDLVDMGFDGVDINMGCPDKAVVKNGCCCALINNRELALEIIKATQKGVAGRVPISVKTRLGFNEIDLTWHELLLNQKLDMISIHGRTKKQLSNVPVDWESIGEIRKLRDRINPNTLIVGNGDVLSREQGIALSKKYKLDGIMIGKGVFNDPFVFSKHSPWSDYSMNQRLQLYKKHVKLFSKTWPNGESRMAQLNKFCKVYINGFDGSKELREQFMKCRSFNELLVLIDDADKKLDLLYT